MSYRTYLVSAAAKAKRQGLLDFAIRYNPLARFQVSRTIEQFRRGDLHERRRLSDYLTSRTIAAARTSSYGNRFGERYEDWPVMTKPALRDAAAALMRRTFIKIPAATGGTTGVPLLLQRSVESIAAEQIFLDSVLGPDGPAWGPMRIAVLRGDIIKDPKDMEPPYGIRTNFGRRLLLSPVHLNPQTFPWYLEAVRSFRPQILLAFPNQALNFLRLLDQSGQRIELQAIVTSSERLAPDVRRVLEASFGVPVYDFYGQSERVCFASSRSAETYYFDPAYGRVELRPAEWCNAGPGRRGMAIIGTSFWNTAMPLVRYDTGDLAIVPDTATPEELEQIALGLRPFPGIAGRDDEFVLTPDGMRVTSLSMIAREVDHLMQVQLIQEPCGEVVVQAIVRPGFDATDRAQLIANMQAKIPASISYRLEFVDRLITTSTGKTPLVIRRLAAQTS